ncbi:MAG TPA: SDR family NAD(P)-dependent oxidoreductase [Gemmataceae bacterium]|nr:SDR family NAD(P)-dependent oxidoreductase [Gemmataceae bacterium]
MNSGKIKVALITGAGSGIGRELARTLAAEGTAIAAIDKKSEGLAELAEEMQRQNRTMAWEVADVTDALTLRQKVGELEERLGPVDLLIANAGVGLETSALCLQPEDVTTVLQVNLLGVAHSIAAVLPGMLKRRSGHIVGISSLASYRGVPRMLAYCASKSGVNAFLEGLRVEVRPYTIAVTIICPGWVKTPMTANIRGPRLDMMEADAAAKLIVAAIRKRRKFFAFPNSLAWRLRLLRWLPCAVSDWLIAKMDR